MSRVLDQVKGELVRVTFKIAFKGRAVVREAAWATVVDGECDSDPVL